MENKNIDIYSAVIIFRKSKKTGNLSTKVKIRDSKKSKQIKENLDGMPEGIRIDDLSWSERYKGHYLTVIERVEKEKYVDRHIREDMPVIIGINLENLVKEIYNQKNK